MKKLLVIIITIMTNSSSFADLDVNGNIVLGSEIKASDFNTRFSVIKTKFNNKGLDLLNNQSNPDSAINFDPFAGGGTEDVSKTKILDQLSKIPLETNGINTLSNEISSNELNLWFNFLENLADTYQPPIACTQTEALLNGVNNSNVTSYTGTYSGDDYTNCLIEQCENNYSKSLDEKSCIEDTRACLVSDLINQTGVETVSGNYGLATNDSSNCTIDTCQTEFNLNNDVCEPAIIPDTPLNIDYKNISLGNDNSFFLNPVDEKVYSWGSNNSGQLGIGLNQSSQSQSLIPIAVDDSLLGQAKMISAYSGHVCAIRKSDDKLFCWGRNNFGQLGNNSTNDSLVPTAVDDSVLGAVAYVSVGGNFTCAIRKIDNKLFCWGTNSYGRLGINNSNTDTSSSFPVPTAVDSSVLSRVSYVELGGSHACAIRRDDDKLFCWGRNNWGQIGNNGELTDIFISPALVEDNVLNAVSTVSAGPSSTCALRKSDGKPYCWGSNQFEMLGLGSTVTRITSPSAVVDTLLGASSEIKVGFSHSCAIKASNNKVYCWGRRFNGSIGDSSTQQFVNVSTPSLIDDSLLDAASQLDVSNTFSCAIKNSDNQLFCWGGNGDGQLGDGTQNNRFSPRAVDQTNL